MLRIVVFAIAGVVAIYLLWNIVHFFVNAYKDRRPAKRKKRERVGR